MFINIELKNELIRDWPIKQTKRTEKVDLHFRFINFHFRFSYFLSEINIGSIQAKIS